MMRILLVATVATAAISIATPAAAKNGAWYIGGDIGALFPNKNHYDTIATSGANVIDIQHALSVKYKTGIDIDLNAGYDFGMFKVEGEVGWKKANNDRLEFTPEFLTAVSNVTHRIQVTDDFDLGGDADIISAMVNGLLDFDFDSSQTFGGYVGGGIGAGWLKEFHDTKSSFAFQGIAGLRYAVSPNFDIGLKYRYFAMGNLDYHAAALLGTVPFDVSLHGKFHSNSVLANFTYNFGAPLPPPPPPPPLPPPPPPEPATQTCPDGSVVLATSACPAPPPPPPPPVERGERGD